MMNQLIPVLITYIVIREIVYIYFTNKLLNKLMSRNYQEYEYSKNMSKTLQSDKPEAKVDDGVAEDLAPIFGLN